MAVFKTLVETGYAAYWYAENVIFVQYMKIEFFFICFAVYSYLKEMNDAMQWVPSS